MPLQLLDSPCSKSVCGIWNITEDKSFFLKYINNYNTSGFEDIHHPAKQIQWLASRMLVKVLMEDYWSEPFVGLYNDEYGKPWIKNSSAHLSISNSNNIATAMIHKNKPVGIDVELIKPKIQLIASKFLTPQEQSFVGEDIERLTLAWCLKEAIYKIYGLGNISLKDHIQINPFSELQKEGFATALLNIGKTQYYKLKYFQLDNYMLAYNYYIENINSK